MTPPFLTLVVTGRNDDFGGDFALHFLRALRFNYRQLVNAGVDVEIVFVEWRPLAGRPWLATRLAEAFPDLAGRRLFSVVVDEAYHAALSLDDRLVFQECIAKNVGIRRARAPFVLSTNSGVLLGRQIVEFLRGRSLASRTLYRATRVDVSPTVDLEGSEGGTVLDDVRHHLGTYPMRPPYFPDAAGDFQLMDAAGYAEVRGYNEVARRARIQRDANLCYKARSMGIPIVDVGGVVYHAGPETVVNEDAPLGEHPETAPGGDTRWHLEKVVYENPESWGLRDAPEQQLSHHTTYLEFDWRAVPPLVDLRRLVLPAFRLDADPRREMIEQGPPS